MSYPSLLSALIFTVCAFCWSTKATAQLEMQPYLGYLKVVNDPSRIDLGENRYVAGIDVHVGSRHLAPLFGLVYGSRGTETNGGDLRFNRIWLPLGLAYRLRPADASFNVVAHGAFVPGLTWVSYEEQESEWHYRLRGGLTLYLDFITLGADYYYGLTDGELENTASGPFVLRLGGRF